MRSLLFFLLVLGISFPPLVLGAEGDSSEASPSLSDPSPLNGDLRTWTEKSGQFTFNAELVGQDLFGHVTLRTESGKTIQMKVNDLSREDQDYLQRMSEAGPETGEIVVANDPAEEAPVDVRPGGRFSEKKIPSGEKITGWNVRPHPYPVNSVTPPRRPVRILTDAKFDRTTFFNDKRLLIGEESNNRAVYYFQTGLSENRTHYIEICDLDSGRSRLFPLPFKIKSCELSPDGTSLLGIRDIGYQEDKSLLGRLAIFSLENSGPTLSFELIPYITFPSTPTRRDRTRISDFSNASWADDNHILTEKDGRITFWDLTQGEALYSLDAFWHGVDISPDQTLIAFPVPGRIEIRKMTTGKLLGVLPTDDSAVGSFCAFSPDGMRLAVLTNDVLEIFDLKTGKLIDEFPSGDHLLMNALFWTGSDSLLVGNTLWDLPHGIPLCRYKNLKSKSRETAYDDGVIWTVLEERFGTAKTVGIAGFKLPHAKAIDLLKTKDPADLFVIYPGSSVRLELELSGFADEDKTRNILIDRLAKNRIHVDENAKTVLTIRYADTGKTADVALTKGGEEDLSSSISSTFSRLWNGRSKSDILELKVFSQEILISEDGSILWRFGKLTTGPRPESPLPEGSEEETLQTLNKPDPNFIQVVPIPKYLSKKETDGNALTEAELRFSGIQ